MWQSCWESLLAESRGENAGVERPRFNQQEPCSRYSHELRFLISTRYVPGSIVDAEDTVVNKADKPVAYGASVLEGRQIVDKLQISVAGEADRAQSSRGGSLKAEVKS